MIGFTDKEIAAELKRRADAMQTPDQRQRAAARSAELQRMDLMSPLSQPNALMGSNRPREPDLRYLHGLVTHRRWRRIWKTTGRHLRLNIRATTLK